MQLISGSVGDGGANAKSDVALVQAILVKTQRPATPKTPAGSYLGNYDGDCGKNTKAAIRFFQDDNVFVSADGKPAKNVAWTAEPAHYVVYSWAGDRLLFYRVGLGEKLELLVADGSMKIRPLADGSAIAISPDASRVAVLSQDATNVRVLDVATGRELSWLDVTTATPPLASIAYSGSWVGDHIVAPASVGLAVFHAGSGSLTLEQVLSLDRAQFPVGVQQPRFLDDAGNEIAASADIPPANGNGGVSFLLQCDRIARSCERGEPAPAKEWLRPVDDTAAKDEGGH